MYIQTSAVNISNLRFQKHEKLSLQEYLVRNKLYDGLVSCGKQKLIGSVCGFKCVNLEYIAFNIGHMSWYFKTHHLCMA